MSIHFFSADSRPPVFPKKKAKVFIEQLFLYEGKDLGGLNIVFCSDSYLLQINRDYLQHDYYTDIITFDLSGEHPSTHGEIYISVDRIRENARRLKEPVQEELLRVIFHGALHLCGYKDKSPAQQLKMRSMENFYLQRFHVEQ